jgi:hypothetical protein
MDGILVTDHIKRYQQHADDLLSITQKGIYIIRHRKWFFFSRYYLFYWSVFLNRAVLAGSFSSLERAHKHGQRYVDKELQC